MVLNIALDTNRYRDLCEGKAEVLEVLLDFLPQNREHADQGCGIEAREDQDEV